MATIKKQPARSPLAPPEVPVAEPVQVAPEPVDAPPAAEPLLDPVQELPPALSDEEQMAAGQLRFEVDLRHAPKVHLHKLPSGKWLCQDVASKATAEIAVAEDQPLEEQVWEAYRLYTGTRKSKHKPAISRFVPKAN